MAPITIPHGLGFKVAYAKQAAAGTPSTAAAYGVPVWNAGTQIEPVRQLNSFDVPATDMLRPGYFISQESWQTNSLVFGGFVDSTPMLYMGLLGQDTVTGTTPKIHTITAADPPGQAFTFWVARPDTSGVAANYWDQFSDGIVTGVELQYAAGQPIKIAVDAVGQSYAFGASAPTITTANAYTDAGPYLSAVSSTAATLKMDVATVPASTDYAARVVSCSIKIMRATTLDQTSSITPNVRSHGLITAAFSATVEYNDLSFYRGAFGGGASGTGPSGLPLTGAIDFKFQEGPTSGANSLEILAPFNFESGPPAFDPSGGPVKLTISGQLDKSASQALQVIGNNSVTSYAAS